MPLFNHRRSPIPGFLIACAVVLLVLRTGAFGPTYQRAKCGVLEWQASSLAKKSPRCSEDAECTFASYLGCANYAVTTRTHAAQLQELDASAAGKCQLEPGECVAPTEPLKVLCISGTCGTIRDDQPAPVAAASPLADASPVPKFRLKLDVFPYGKATRTKVNGVAVNPEGYLGEFGFDEPVLLTVEAAGYVPFRQQLTIYPSMLPADGIYQKEIRLDRAPKRPTGR